MRTVSELNQWSDYYTVAALLSTGSDSNFSRLLKLSTTFQNDLSQVSPDIQLQRDFVKTYMGDKFSRIITNSKTIFDELNLMARRGHVKCVRVLIDCNGEIQAESDFGRT